MAIERFRIDDALGIPLYCDEGFIVGGNIDVRYPINE